ncbi:TetR/AcrR family transcriptional regulator C-terminal domain-containing protein [Nocardia abscessus]|uniref:TetR/AcrR family transcriptional regulator n=1 Tax=Nocardia abscessus TaxID=120957 RepID=UPI001893C65A|nr:TetR/AcrR family transcriptional regulator C-terminal domain-containing protein [Nocardia abscessus]MBF6338923.1 TetR/AcrR family transcriptional regulator C-terminal domain-containing protein [Nocardia abscessus]
MTGPATSTPPASAPRRGRPPKAETQLSRAAIREAALAVIDADGIGAVSMRTVGRVLGVDAKSLYHHVAGKDDLLDAIAEHILGQLRVPAPTDSVEDDLRALAHEFRRVTLSHPQAAILVLTRQLSSQAGLAPIEAVLTVLRRTGNSAEEAVHLLRTLLATLVGTLLREVSAGPTFGTSDADGIAERERSLEASGLPQVVLAAPHLARFDRDREFDYTVDLLVRVVTSRLDTAE